MVKLKNSYSDSTRTFERIQKCLIDHRAKHIAYEYNDNGQIVGLTFGIDINGNIAGVKLPARVENVHRILFGNMKYVNKQIEQSRKDNAYRTAWANIRDWIEAQMALVDTEMVKLEEVFLPYIVMGDQTVFEKLQSQNFQLKSGKE